DEADLWAAGIGGVWRTLGLDAGGRQPGKLVPHGPAHAKGDVAVGIAQVVGLRPSVVQRQLELVVVARKAEEDHGRRVAADAGATPLLEAERAVEGERAVLVDNAEHRVQKLARHAASVVGLRSHRTDVSAPTRQDPEGGRSAACASAPRA